MSILRGIIGWIIAPCVISFASCAEENKIRLTIGQDLSAIRGYTESNCCPNPGGVTAYISMYSILDKKTDFGGSGLNNSGQLWPKESNWGGGPTNAFMIARENPTSALSIGLSLTENDHPGAILRLTQGDYDKHIDKLITLLRLIEQPTYLRIGYEFDGSWNKGYENSENYIIAFRRIASRIRSANLEKVILVWQGATSPVDDLIDGEPNPVEPWYPGSDLVDMIGLSWFLKLDEHPATPGKAIYHTQRQKMDLLLAYARSKGKPVMISESAPQGYDLNRETNSNIAPILDGPAAKNRIQTSGQKIWNEWYQPFFNYIHTNRDIIRHVAYINANWNKDDLWDAPYEGGYWGDSRIEVNAYIRKKWQQEINKPIWQHGSIK